MTGLDTNVLVRYIMQDDPRQSPRATRLIESLDADRPGFVSLVSIERTAAAAGCKESVTFDTDAARHAGMALIR